MPTPEEKKWEQRVCACGIVPPSDAVHYINCPVNEIHLKIKLAEEAAYQRGREDEAIDHTKKDVNAYQAGKDAAEIKLKDLQKMTAYSEGYHAGMEAMKAKAVEIIKSLTTQNRSAKCKEHSTPRGISAVYYDCADLHIGYEEMTSDAIAALHALPTTPNDTTK